MWIFWMLMALVKWARLRITHNQNDGLIERTFQTKEGTIKDIIFATVDADNIGSTSFLMGI